MGNNKNSMLDSVLVVTAVVVSSMLGWYFKMDFWENFFSCLIAGLLVILTVWVVKGFNRKKLFVIMVPKKITNSKYRFHVLLWNPSWLRNVYSSDYGSQGFRFFADYDVAICDLKKHTKIRYSNEFSFTIQKTSADNALNLHMGNLLSHAFIELEFSVYKAVRTTSCRKIILPFDVRTDEDSFENIPNISIHYDRSCLNIKELKYRKTTQILHWFCICAALLTIVGTPIVAFLSKLSIINVIGVGAMILTTIATASFGLGNFVPPFVVKYMKRKGYIDYNE